MTDETRGGDWMVTYTGRKFWPLDPRPEDVSIFDIAHALSNQCRFSGHCPQFYSVARHSILVAGQLAPPYKLWGLMHDAAEAYLSDMIRPIKGLMPEYRLAERHALHAVATRYHLGEMPATVEVADARMLATEAAALFPGACGEWTFSGEPFADFRPEDFFGLPEDDETVFLDAFWKLMTERERGPASA